MKYNLNPSSRIIFLDVDGVLNLCGPGPESLIKFYDQSFGIKSKLWGEQTHPDLYSHLIDRLNQLIDDTGAVIVLSSSWRILEEQKPIERLIKAGVRDVFIGSTPVLRDRYSVRGNEIFGWVKDNQTKLGCYSKFNSYVILDDDSDMLYWQRNNFINVDYTVGLTAKNCYAARQILEGRRS